MNVSDVRTPDSGLESEGDLVSRLTVQLKGFFREILVDYDFFGFWFRLGVQCKVGGIYV